jgi:hypothetical protein
MDLATTSGFCRYDGEKFETTTFKANVKKNILDDSKGIDASREGEIGRKFQDFLQCWLIENRIEYTAIEAPLPSNTTRRKRVVNTSSDFAGQSLTYQEVGGVSQSAVFRMYGLEFCALALCNRLNIPVLFVHQATWRKTFLGNGKPTDAKKEAVKMCQRLGIQISSVDAAESVGVCKWLDEHLNPYSHRRANDLFSGKQSISVQEYRAEAEALFKK